MSRTLGRTACAHAPPSVRRVRARRRGRPGVTRQPRNPCAARWPTLGGKWWCRVKCAPSPTCAHSRLAFVRKSWASGKQRPAGFVETPCASSSALCDSFRFSVSSPPAGRPSCRHSSPRAPTAELTRDSRSTRDERRRPTRGLRTRTQGTGTRSRTRGKTPRTARRPRTQGTRAPPPAASTMDKTA